MPTRASQGALLRHAALRRFVAGACMLAFVVVGFAHGISCLDISVPPTASQAGDKLNASSDSPPEAGLIAEHHLCCTIIAITPNSCDLSFECDAKVGVSKADAVLSHNLALELPPPKSLT
jgi:hypothetical protein